MESKKSRPRIRKTIGYKSDSTSPDVDADKTDSDSNADHTSTEEKTKDDNKVDNSGKDTKSHIMAISKSSDCTSE